MNEPVQSARYNSEVSGQWRTTRYIILSIPVPRAASQFQDAMSKSFVPASMQSASLRLTRSAGAIQLHDCIMLFFGPVLFEVPQ